MYAYEFIHCVNFSLTLCTFDMHACSHAWFVSGWKGALSRALAVSFSSLVSLLSLTLLLCDSAWARCKRRPRHCV
jgi:hypothetical protein